jgi:hypothetical protein
MVSRMYELGTTPDTSSMVFSSCAWVGIQQRISAMAIVNFLLVQFEELSRVLLLIHFHLLGKCTWNRCGPFGLWV